MSLGNSPAAPTGYGGQSMQMVRGAIAAGFDVVILPWNFMLHGSLGPGIPVIPHRVVLERFSDLVKHFTPEDNALFGKHALWVSNPYNAWPVVVQKAHLNEIILSTKCSLFVAFQDIFVFERGPFACQSMVWIPLHFIPLEHKTVESLCDFDVHVAMCHWGEYHLKSIFGHMGRHSPKNEMIYHGRDTKLFKPLDALSSPLFRGVYLSERETLRTALGWPADAFVILIVAAYNEASNRKALDAQLQGAVRFMQSTTKKTFLHVHSGSGGEFDVPRMLEILGEYPDRYPTNVMWEAQNGKVQTAGYTFAAPAERITGPRFAMSCQKDFMGLTEADMVKLYQASDVLLVAACSEGFGVPIIEAQLCGTPVVTNMTTSMPELTYFGVCVPPCQWTVRADFNSGWPIPSAAGIERALAKVSGWSFEDRVRMFAEVRPKLLENFDFAVIAAKWSRLIRRFLPDASDPDSIPDRRPQLRATFRQQFQADKLSSEADRQLQWHMQTLVRLRAAQIQRSALRRLIESGLVRPPPIPTLGRPPK